METSVTVFNNKQMTGWKIKKKTIYCWNKKSIWLKCSTGILRSNQKGCASKLLDIRGMISAVCQSANTEEHDQQMLDFTEGRCPTFFECAFFLIVFFFLTKNK